MTYEQYIEETRHRIFAATIAALAVKAGLGAGNELHDDVVRGIVEEASRFAEQCMREIDTR